MNWILVARLLALALSATLFAGMQSAAATTSSPFAGTWKGTMNGLPSIDLTIQQSDSKVSGSVVFYFQERKDANSPWHATADQAFPLRKPRVEGRVLTFEVEHHVCRGCKALGPNTFFQMELAGADEAKLTRFQPDAPLYPLMKLVREKTGTAQAAPPLQKGISIEMPLTNNAVPMPEADRQDALIVTITSDGKLYLGTTPTDLGDLAAGLQTTVASRSLRKTLYIKADARVSYATLLKVVDVAIDAGIERTVLLTTQKDALEPPSAIVPPRGLMIVNARPELSL